MVTPAKYRDMKAAGVSPRRVYDAARSDGMDDIALIRLLRELFGLSLGEVKQLIGNADDLAKKQNVTVGATVYWEGGRPPRTSM